MGRSVGCKLGQKQARALHRSHAFSPSALTLPFEGELLCRYINSGKKIPFVKCDGARYSHDRGYELSRI